MVRDENNGRGPDRPTDVLSHYLNRRRLGAYLDGALDEGTARSTAAHLATCGVCQREAAELRRLKGLLHETLAVADPDWTGFWPGVVRGVEVAKHATPVPVPARRRAWRPQWALGGALAAALLASIGVWQFGPSSTTQDGVIVRSASTGDPKATVMVYGTPERDVAVVWVLGLDSN
jgi:anti-sigma factor RsiW